ncbi:MAG TPA: hypothetical protein V6D17_19195 [Candidatus Obscuribacterales bacterium]
MQLGFTEQASNGSQYVNVGLTREGVLSRFWLQTYQYQSTPRAPKQMKEKASVSRFGSSKGWAGFLTAIFR